MGELGGYTRLEAVVREIIPRLIENGTDGIIEYSLNKLVSRGDRIG